MTTHEVAVIGRGIIGSAAARHLAESGTSVVLIGPDEPVDRRTSSGPFSSHPDEGRITRIAGRSELWTELAARSLARYADIAARSGIAFHTPRAVAVGYPDAEDWIARGASRGSDARLVGREWLRAETGIAITKDIPVLWEGPPAGWINPRSMVRGQTRLVEAAGGTVVRAAAERMSAVPGGLEITGPFGAVRVARALVATGAFGAELLDVALDVDRRPRTTLMAEIADPGVGERIPSLILDGPPDNRLHEIYWVPPVRYPDGRICLKIGGNLKEHPTLAPDDLVEWFHTGGAPTEIEALENSLRALLPDVEWRSFTTAPCVITGTPTGHPYIGWVADRVAVAVGGNGSAAKSGDELGRLAATLFREEGWDSTLDASAFAPRFA